MKLSELEKKLIILALDKAATLAEGGLAAQKLFEFFRRKYPDGYALIKDLEGLPEPRVVVHERVVYREGESAEQRRVRIWGKTVLPFGKHKGKQIDMVPADYLIWMQDNCNLKGGLDEAIAGWLGRKGRTRSNRPSGGFEF